jgi:hypothetical protein
MFMKQFGLIMLVFFSLNAHALLCPNSFDVINIGDNTSAVQKVCGAPNSERTYSAATSNTPVEWEFVKPNRIDQFTSRVKFLLSENKVANITITNGNQNPNQICQAIQLGSSGTNLQLSCSTLTPSDVSQTDLCGGMIRVGDSVKVVEFICGKPLTMHPLQGGSGSPVAITEYTYSGAPPAVLVFENGQLKEKR